MVLALGDLLNKLDDRARTGYTLHIGVLYGMVASSVSFAKFKKRFK